MERDVEEKARRERTRKGYGVGKSSEACKCVFKFIF